MTYCPSIGAIKRTKPVPLLFLRAQWKMGNWANEYRNPLFGFQVTLDSEPRLSQAAAR